jgi:hypothetical protein
MSEPRRDTPEGVVAGIAQALSLVLTLTPHAEKVPICRDWLAQWLRELEVVLAFLRRAPQERDR